MNDHKLKTFFRWNCDSDETYEILVKNAPITLEETEVDTCFYSIRTEDKEKYTTDRLPGSYSETNFDAKITFKVTKGGIDSDFGDFLYKLEILELIKL